MTQETIKPDRGRLNRAVYRVAERLGADFDVLGALGSIDDTLSDGEVAGLLEDWLESGRMLHEKH